MSNTLKIIYHIKKISAGLCLTVSSIFSMPTHAAVGIIDLDINEPASTTFDMYYYNGETLVETTYDGFKSEKYPLRVSTDTYLITDTLSLISQQEAGISFTFNGQGLQTLKMELLDLDGAVLWSYCNDNLYSGTTTQNGKVPYKEVKASDIAITPEGSLPALCRLRLRAASGKDAYKLHLHALNLYSTPNPSELCSIVLASPVVATHQNLYLSWISINGASSYKVIAESVSDDVDTAPTEISIPTTKRATHHAKLSLDGYKTINYRIEALLGDQTVVSQTWTHTVDAGITTIQQQGTTIRRVDNGIVITTAYDGVVDVYTPMGVRVAHPVICKHTPTLITLPPGIYIVRSLDKALKMYIK